jgi:Superfamily I DNA and RNA helicases
MKPTEEQAHAIACATSGGSLALEALAGSGKSSTLKMIAAAMPSRRMLYTAFSAQVVKDAKSAFPRNVRVQTNHGLAYASVGAAYKHRMERRLTPWVVAEGLGMTQASYPGRMKPEDVAQLALEAVLRYQQSADLELTKQHARVPGGITQDREEVAAIVLQTARKLWNDLADPAGKLPITHDTYLKLWALSCPKLNFDAIMLDEAQDANPVITDVLTRQQTQLIVVGDRYQQIYSWRGAVNAMSAFPIKERAWLTQSFRFGNTVAQAANAVLTGHLDAQVRVRGNPAISDSIAAFDQAQGQYALVARKNATLIGEVFNQAGRRVAVVGGVTDLIKLVEGVEKLQRGELAITCPDLADFKDWGEVKDYAGTEAGRHLAMLVRLVEYYGTWRLTQALRSVEGNERDEASCHVILSTAHRSKGREWDRVILADDYPEPDDEEETRDPSESRSKWNPEEANLLYVAATRAKAVLDVEQVGAWRHAVRAAHEAGHRFPGLSDDPRFAPQGGPARDGDPDGHPVAPPKELSVKQCIVAELYLAALGVRPASQETLAAIQAAFGKLGYDSPESLRLLLE